MSQTFTIRAVIMLLCLVSCQKESVVTAPGQDTIQNGIQSINRVGSTSLAVAVSSYFYSTSLDGIEVGNPCATESMILNGNIETHIVERDVNGERHLIVTLRYEQVTATGTITGTVYKAREVAQNKTIILPSGVSYQAINSKQVLTSAINGISYTAHSRILLHIDDNGTTVIDKIIFDFEGCK